MNAAGPTLVFQETCLTFITAKSHSHSVKLGFYNFWNQNQNSLFIPRVKHIFADLRSPSFNMQQRKKMKEYKKKLLLIQSKLAVFKMNIICSRVVLGSRLSRFFPQEGKYLLCCSFLVKGNFAVHVLLYCSRSWWRGWMESSRMFIRFWSIPFIILGKIFFFFLLRKVHKFSFFIVICKQAVMFLSCTFEDHAS